MPDDLKRAFRPDSPLFRPIPKPKAGDWLASHREAGQSFDQWSRSGAPRPGKTRRVIYLQPVGKFDESAPSLKALREYTAAYFQCETKVAPLIDPKIIGARSRVNPHSGKQQLLCGDVMGYLKRRLPKDAFCVLAVTMIDLYPDEDWNFVFGMASLSERVGVFSFARHDPAFFGETSDAPEGDTDRLVLSRSYKVLSHEIGHMFGIRHCVHYHCNMNGSNSLAESDQAPLWLCPVCLRKMQTAVGFDPLERNLALWKIYRADGFREAAKWSSQRTAELRGK